jgi:hypothetical protein
MNRMKRVSFRCAAALMCLGWAWASAEVQRIALFVGEDRGLEEERPLRYASRDAKEMAEAFRRAGTFDEDRVYVLVNPTLDKIKSSLEEIRGRVAELRRAGTESLVMLYYSGHGSAEGLHIQGKIFSKEDFTQYVGSLESNLKILILDACESGDFLRSKGGRLVEAPKVVKIDRLESKGTIMISSSSRGEMAQESEDYRGAVFTHHFLNGLRGLADYDGDRSIRLMEAFDYARVSTKREEIQGQVAQQNPGFDFDMIGESDPVVARIGGQQSQLLLRHMPSGPMEIYNGNSMELECRIWLTGQDSLRFSLPASKYVLAYRDRNVNRIAEVDLTWQRTVRVSPDGFRTKGKSLLNEKGGRILDMHYNGVQLSARRASMFTDLNISQAEYVFRGYWAKQTLGFSYAQTVLGSKSTGLENAIRMGGLGYSLETPVLRGARGQVLLGAQASYHWVFQTVKDHRFGGSPVVVDGAPLDTRRESTANLIRLTLPLEGEIFFPYRFWLSATVAGAYYGYGFHGASSSFAHWGVEPALSLGHQF